MVQVLQGIEEDSLGAQLGRSLGKGLTGGFEKGLALGEKLAGKRAKKEAQRSKLEGTASRDFAAFTKQYHPTLYEDKDLLNKANNLYKEIIESNPDFSESDKEKAFALAVKGAQTISQQTKPESKFGRFFDRPKEGGLFKDVGNYFKPAYEALKQRPSLAYTELPSATGKFEENLEISPLNNMLKDIGRNISGAEKQKGEVPTVERMLASKFREDVPEELKEGAERISDIESMIMSFIPIPGAKRFWRSSNKLGKQQGISTKRAAENILKRAESEGIDVAKAASGDAQEVAKLNSFSGRISQGAPKAVAATEKRVARVEPKSKLFKTAEEQATREKQLKQVSKYQTEIEKDTADRIARREKLVPKTEAGKQSLQGRIANAEKSLPKAREDYYKASGRVRALEDHLVNVAESEKSYYEGLLKAAQKDLTDAEFLMNSTLNNAKTGSSKVGFDEMRQSARTKMMDVSDKISEGAEVQLLKRDYNPEFIKEAKAIAKKKPLPGQDVNDYFTQVHSEYANEYKNQIGRIGEEIKTLPKNMSGVQRLRELEKEKGILNKFVDHIEAENVIHRRKLALRGMAERQKANQRLKQFEVKKEGGKVSEVGRQKIQEQAKSAVKNPTGPEAEALAYKAGVKKENIGDAIKEVEDAFKGVKEKAPNTPLKRLLHEGKKFLEAWKTQGWYKAFTKTTVGQEILFTISDVAASEALGSGALIFSGSGLRPKRLALSAIRKGIIFAWRKGKKELLTNQYVEAVKKGDEKKRSEIAKKHPKIATEGRKRLLGP